MQPNGCGQATGRRPAARVDGGYHGRCGAGRRIQAALGGRIWTLKPTPDPVGAEVSVLSSVSCSSATGVHRGRLVCGLAFQFHAPAGGTMGRQQLAHTADSRSQRHQRLALWGLVPVGSLVRRCRQRVSQRRASEHRAHRDLERQALAGSVRPGDQGSVLALCGLVHVGEFMRCRRPHPGRATTRHQSRRWDGKTWRLQAIPQLAKDTTLVGASCPASARLHRSRLEQRHGKRSTARPVLEWRQLAGAGGAIAPPGGRGRV